MAPRIKKTKVEEPVVETKVEEVVEEKKPAKKTTKKKTSVKIKAPRVNIRKTPSLLGEVLNIAAAGDKFNLVNDSEDGFYEIEFEGKNAFVMKDYAELS